VSYFASAFATGSLTVLSKFFRGRPDGGRECAREVQPFSPCRMRQNRAGQERRMAAACLVQCREGGNGCFAFNAQPSFISCLAGLPRWCLVVGSNASCVFILTAGCGGEDFPTSELLLPPTPREGYPEFPVTKSCLLALWYEGRCLGNLPTLACSSSCESAMRSLAKDCQVPSSVDLKVWGSGARMIRRTGTPLRMRGRTPHF